MTSYTAGPYPNYRLRPLATATAKALQALRWLSRQAATSDQDQDSPATEPSATFPSASQPDGNQSPEKARLTPIRPRRLPSSPDGQTAAPRPSPGPKATATRPLPRPRPVRQPHKPPADPPISQTPEAAPETAPVAEIEPTSQPVTTIFDETRSLPKIGPDEPDLADEGTETPDPSTANPETPIDPQVQEWVRRAQEGDNEAFGKLYDTYVNLVFRYVYYRIGNKALAEDFTSETFLRALRRIGTFTWTGRDIGAWFVTIARNILRDHVKSSRYRMETSSAEILETDQVTDGPEREVLDNMANSQLWSTVKKLNADQQECIVLRFIQGLSVAETAKIMGRNEGAIKALQHRAVKRLGKLLPGGLR